MDPDPLGGLSDCSSTSARSSWSSSAAEDSEDEWRQRVDELRWYIDPSPAQQNGDAVRDDVGEYEVSRTENNNNNNSNNNINNYHSVGAGGHD